MDTNNEIDVVIVGGGFAGLSAATRLKEKGRTVAVLEARERVGGRTWTITESDYWIDNGAQWITDSQTRIVELCAKAGVEMIPGFPAKGKVIFIFQGNRYDFEIDENEGEWLILTRFFKENFLSHFNEYLAAEKKLGDMARQVPTDTPWKAEKAALLDTMTVQTWIDQNIKSDGAKFLLRQFCLSYFASVPADISLLHMLFYLNAAGGPAELQTCMNYRLNGGTMQLTEHLAKGLGDAVKLNTPVREIDQSGKNVIVKTDKGIFVAKKVIVAISAAITSRIQFFPALPASRVQFQQRAPLGSSIKCHLVYKTPFWEPEYNGVVMSDKHLLSVVANNNPPQKASAEEGVTRSIPGVLGCFIETAKVRDNIDVPEEELKKMVKKAIEEIFKPSIPDMPEPLAVYVTNWCNEEWSGGCYSSPLPPGVWTGYKNAIREPVKNIFWAGTETSPRWNSYMEGAIRSGERAAEEADKSLG